MKKLTTERLLHLFIEQIRLECKYFTGDEEQCKKFGHCATNCDGDIRECDGYDYGDGEPLPLDEIFKGVSNRVW